MSGIDVSELRRVAEAATPGPWWTGLGGYVEVNEGDGDYDTIADTYGRTENAEHIAAFDPPTVLALLDRLAAAEAERAKYLAAFSEQFDQREEYTSECKRLWAMEARVEALVAPYYIRDVISGSVTEHHKFHIKARDLRAALDGPQVAGDAGGGDRG